MCNFHIQSIIFNVILITGIVCPYQKHTHSDLYIQSKGIMLKKNVYPWILTI